ncbi:4701_t:CDS:2 [Gigaspora rosea]|nr:4701_t:CDS:2 [Gigaspora rosea]
MIEIVNNYITTSLYLSVTTSLEEPAIRVNIPTKCIQRIRNGIDENFIRSLDAPIVVNKVSIPKVRESHYAPETSVEDDDKGLTNEKKNLKKEEAELNLEAVLGDLTNIYLEVLKNQIPEPTKPKEPEPQFKNPRDYKSKIEMLKLDLEDDFDIDEESLPDY